MFRKRTVDPSFWTDEEIARLTQRQRVFRLGLELTADDEGRLKGNPNFLKATIFPYDSMTTSEIESDIKRILDEVKGFWAIKRYTVDGRSIIQNCNFDKRQYIRDKKASELPLDPDAIPSTPTPTPPPTITSTQTSTPTSPTRQQQHQDKPLSKTTEYKRVTPSKAIEAVNDLVAKNDTLEVRLMLLQDFKIDLKTASALAKRCNLAQIQKHYDNARKAANPGGYMRRALERGW